MNAREIAGKIYVKLENHKKTLWDTSRYGSRQRKKIMVWLKHYGADAESYSQSHYILTKKRSMGGPIKNPAGGKPCEYCRLLHNLYQRSSGKEKRRVLARFRMHRRALHTNPPDKRRLKIARVAVKLAWKLYKHFKEEGVPAFVMNRVPAEVRPYVEDILRYNGVKVLTSNPFRRARKRRKRR